MENPIDNMTKEAAEGVTEAPFLLVSQAPTATCEKCGSPTVAPGRIALYDGEDFKVWCDCITEDEMQDVVKRYTDIRAMWLLDENKVDA